MIARGERERGEREKEATHQAGEFTMACDHKTPAQIGENSTSSITINSTSTAKTTFFKKQQSTKASRYLSLVQGSGVSLTPLRQSSRAQIIFIKTSPVSLHPEYDQYAEEGGFFTLCSFQLEQPPKTLLIRHLC